MAYSLNSHSLGNIQKESMRKIAELTILPIPLSNSNEAETTDFNGAQREITIEGRYADTSLSNIKSNFLDNIEGILDGDQASTVNYVSDLYGTIAVKVDEFHVENDTETTGPLSVSYTIRMLESA